MDFNINQGLVNLAINDATFQLQAVAGVVQPHAVNQSPVAIGRVSYATLNGRALDSWASVEPVGPTSAQTASGTLPASVSGAVSLPGQNILLLPSNPLSPEPDPQVGMDDCLRSLASHTPDFLRSLMVSIGDLLDALANSALMNQTIPFTNETIGGQLKLRERWNEVLIKLETQTGQAAVKTLEDFLNRIGAKNASFNQQSCIAQFDLSFASGAARDAVLLALSEKMKVIDSIDTRSTGRLLAQLEGDFRIGLDLKQLGIAVTSTTPLAALNVNQGVRFIAGADAVITLHDGTQLTLDVTAAMTTVEILSTR